MREVLRHRDLTLAGLASRRAAVSAARSCSVGVLVGAGGLVGGLAIRLNSETPKESGRMPAFYTKTLEIVGHLYAYPGQSSREITASRLILPSLKASRKLS